MMPDYRAPRRVIDASSRVGHFLARLGAVCKAVAKTAPLVVAAALSIAAALLLIKFIILETRELWPRVDDWVF